MPRHEKNKSRHSDYTNDFCSLCRLEQITSLRKFARATNEGALFARDMMVYDFKLIVINMRNYIFERRLKVCRLASLQLGEWEPKRSLLQPPLPLLQPPPSLLQPP